MLPTLLASACVLATFDEVERSKEPAAVWKPLLIQEAPKAWQRCYTRTKQLQGSWSLTTRSLITKWVQKDRFEIKQRDGYSLCLEQTEQTEHLRVSNPKYAFSLRRPRDNAPWVVAQVRVGTSLFRPSTVENPHYVVRMISHFSYTFAGVVDTLQVTLLDEGFSIRTVSPITLQGRRLIKAEFDYSPPKNPARMPLCAGSVVFDPDHYWTIRRFEVQTQWGKDPATEIATFTYHYTQDGFPILQELVNRRKCLGQNADLEFHYRFQLQESDIPEREFRLSAFGFPEPQGIRWENGSRWYLWFIIAAGVSLVAGGYFRYRVQRRKEGTAHQSAPPRPED